VVARGAPTVGVRTDDGVALAAETRRRSPLEVADGIEKVHRIDDGLAVGSAGHVADARHLVDLARRYAQAERLRYGEAPSTGATAWGSTPASSSRSAGSRPAAATTAPSTRPRSP